MTHSKHAARSAAVLFCLASTGCGLVRLTSTVNGKTTTYGDPAPAAPAAPAAASPNASRTRVARRSSPGGAYGAAPGQAPAPAPAPAAPVPAGGAPAAPAPYVAMPAPAAPQGESAGPARDRMAMNDAGRRQQVAAASPSNASDPALGGDDPTANAAALMQQVFGQGPSGAPALGALHPLLERDRAAAERAGKDLSVFGIKLTYPLALPACPVEAPSFLNPLGGVALGAKVSAPCIGSGGIAKMQNEEAMQAARRRLQGADIREATVLFPKQSCPDWLTTDALAQSCYVNAVTRAGHVASVYFVTAGTDWESKIVGTLEKKYGKADPKTTDTYCQVLGRETVRLKVRTFSSTPGLHVTFDPLGGRCPSLGGNTGAGLLTIETNAHHEWLKAAHQKNEKSKMSL